MTEAQFTHLSEGQQLFQIYSACAGTTSSTMNFDAGKIISDGNGNIHSVGFFTTNGYLLDDGSTVQIGSNYIPVSIRGTRDINGNAILLDGGAITTDGSGKLSFNSGTLDLYQSSGQGHIHSNDLLVISTDNGINITTFGGFNITGGQWITLGSALVLNNLASAPSGYPKGSTYYNSTDNHFYGYNGTLWKQLDN